MDMEEATIVRWLVEEGAEVEGGPRPRDRHGQDLLRDRGSLRRGHPRPPRRGRRHPARWRHARLRHRPGEDFLEPQESHTEEVKPERTAEVPKHQTVPVSADSEDGRRVRASPAARRAADMGISIESVSGSGPYGRVYLSDVLEMETEAPLNRPNQRLSMRPAASRSRA